MANGGFKAFKVDVQGKSSATTDDVKTVLDQVLNGIVGTGQGWSKETSKYGSEEIVTLGTDTLAHFLVHTGGARLMVAMNLTENVFHAKNLMNYYSNNPSSCDGALAGGLMMSMIPPTFGDFDLTSGASSSSFLNNKTLRVVGSGCSYSSTFIPKSFLGDDNSGETYRYMICVRQDTIIYASRLHTWQNKCVFYTLGNLFNCAQSEDDSKYGAFRPIVSMVSGNEYEDSSEKINNNTYQPSAPWDFGEGISSAGTIQLYTKGGGLVSGKYVPDPNAQATCACAGSNFNLNVVKNSIGSNTRRFTSIDVELNGVSDNCGVVANDGYKGIINTECLCVVGHVQNKTLPLGTLLDNGNYMHLICGICIGWDSSNTVAFWEN